MIGCGVVVAAKASGMAEKGARPLSGHLPYLYLPSLLCHLVGEKKLRAQKASGGLTWHARSRCSTKCQWKEHSEAAWGIKPLWVSR